MSSTKKIVQYVANSRLEDLPGAVKCEARRAIFNIIGCVIGGSQHTSVAIAERALGTIGGRPDASLFCRGKKTDVLNAALINCLASAVHTYDDTLNGSLVHPSGTTITPLLALSETRRVGGKDFLTAFALGIEMTCRLSKAATAPTANANIGWCATSVTGGLGAAVASGKLLKLDPQRMHYAIGLSLSRASGFRATQGTMNQSLIHSWPAESGLRAALLAEQGFTSTLEPIEGRYGFLSVFGDDSEESDLADRLGERFEILNETYKPYPCGIVIHPIIDACLKLKADHQIHADDVIKVLVRGSAGAVELCDRPHPQNEKQAVVSLQHWAAVALAKGTAGLADLDLQTSVLDPKLQQFQDRIETVLDPSLAADASAVAIELKDGRRFDCQIDHCIGSVSRPLTERELETKFLDQAEPVVGVARARQLAEMSWFISDMDDVGDLPRAAL